MKQKTNAATKPKSQMMGLVLGTAAITVLITLAMMGLASIGGGFATSGHTGSRSWTWPVIAHVATVVPAFVLGAVVLLRRKGTRLHRLMGRAYCALMLLTATSTLFIRAPGAGLFESGYSPIHLFTVMAFTTVPYAIWVIQNGNRKAHRDAMIGSYVGLCIAGAFAFIPGRLLSTAIL